MKVKVKVTQLCLTLQPHGLYSSWNSPGQNTGVGSLSLLQGIFPTQGSKPGLPHCRKILYQLSHKGSPRILEWVAYPFSSGSSSGVELGFPAFISWSIREAPPSDILTQLVQRGSRQPCFVNFPRGRCCDFYSGAEWFSNSDVQSLPGDLVKMKILKT